MPKEEQPAEPPKKETRDERRARKEAEKAEAAALKKREREERAKLKQAKKDGKSAVSVMPLASVLAAVESRFGKDVVRGDAGSMLAIPRIPTGLFELDLAIGGGIPAGRYTLITGEKGSGKSSEALLTLAEWQRGCSTCLKPDRQCQCAGGYRKDWAAFVNLENDWDPAWCGRLGVDLDRVKLIEPDYGEAGIEVAIRLLMAEELNFLIFNSLAAISPSAETEKSFLDSVMGTRAQLVNRMLRSISMATLAKKRRGLTPTVICTNQLYNGMGATKPGMPPPLVEPGGKNQLFAASLVLRNRHIMFIHPGGDGEGEQKKTGDKSKPPNIALQSFQVRYSKVSPPGVSGEIRFVVRNHDGLKVGESDSRALVLAHAQSLGLLRKEEGEWKIGKLAARTKDEIVTAFLQSPEELSKARARIMELTIKAAQV